MKFKHFLEAKMNAVPLPPILYHITTAGSEIDRSGFKTADQHKLGTVLGGSFSDAVSFTYSLERAKYYKMALEFAQELFYDNLMNSRSLWYEIQKFKPNRDKLDQILSLVEKEKDPEEKISTLLFWMPIITNGNFPAMFGAGLKNRLTPDSSISIVSVSTLPGHGKIGPQRWSTNDKEEEFRIYDPENLDHETIDFL